MTRRNRALSVILLAIAAAGPALLSCAGCQSNPFTVRPYLLNPTPTSMTIQWLSAEPGEAIVEYGQGDMLDRKAGPIAGRELAYYPGSAKDEPTASERAVEYVFNARLDGLKPATSYRYRVVLGDGFQDGVFRTAPDKPAPFSFVAYGDTRTDFLTHRLVARRIRDTACDLIIHTGDLTAAGAFRSYHTEFFNPLSDVIDHIPIATQTGNHDKIWDIYHALLPMPGNGRWYSFDYGNVHFVALDSAAEFDERAEQLAWLDKDLAASKADWKVVFYHYPTYDTSRRHTAEGRQDFAPLFRKHGVDLVLTGHSHGYQRLRPMFTRGENEKHPITYMVIAGGGAPLQAMESSDYQASAAKAYCFTRFDVDGGKMTGRTFDQDGRLIDNFVLDKTAGQFSRDYLAEALPEEDFDKLRDFVREQLNATLPAVPQPGRPVRFSFPFTAPPEADITVRLYLDDATVARATVPAGKTVQLAGIISVAEPVRVKDSMLSPKMQLECHFTCGKNKDVVFSQPLSVRADAPRQATPQPLPPE